MSYNRSIRSVLNAILLLACQLLTSVLLLLLRVSRCTLEDPLQLAQRTGTGFIIRAVCRMYIGADWRMNIMRVGCIALTLVALNMVAVSEFEMVEWRVGARVGGEVGRVVLRANVTRRLRMSAGALKTPSR